MNLKKIALLALITIAAIGLAGCTPAPSSSDKMRDAQETSLNQGISSVGPPTISNFRELRMVKDLYELRDKNGISTFTYLKSEVDNKLCFFGETIGYGIPYGTQLSAPSSVQRWFVKSKDPGIVNAYGTDNLPQAEPNGLYMPDSAEGTWIMMKDPDGDTVKPVYIEPRIITSPYKLKGVASCAEQTPTK